MSGRFLIIITAICIIAGSLYSDTGTLVGRIVDEQTGEPIPGVTIHLEGTDLGTVTNVNGIFRFENIPAGEYILMAEFIGFQTTVLENIEVRSGEKDSLFIPLTEVALEEDVVISVPIEEEKREKIPEEFPAVEEPQMPEEIFDEPEPEDSELDADVSQYGRIVFNVPDTLELNQTVLIHLALSPRVELEALERRITEEGELKNRRIRISKIMTADLKGSGFEVIPITETMQAINMEGITDWRWEVTALRPGTRHLHLTINTVIEIDGQERTRTIHSHSELITIHVTLQQRISGFVAENWKWLWSAILVPFAGWFWESRKRRKK